MQVLIIGYGKIGQIKASLWKSLGANVYVHDISQPMQEKAILDGFQPHGACPHDQELVLDISSPAGQHFQSVQWALKSVRSTIKSILVEKPIASSIEELAAFHALDTLVSAKIVLNESYFSSEGLRTLQASVKDTPIRIEIELSKNRLTDLADGRFFDYSLDAVGIETPHMLAILQALDISLKDITIVKAHLFVDPDQEENQGFEIQFRTGSTLIVLKSFLGNFSSHRSTAIKPNRTVRTVKVFTRSHEYQLELDPAPGLPRYHSRLSSSSTDGDQAEIETFQDDHLRNHMVNIMHGNPIQPLLGFDNAAFSFMVLNKLRSSLEIIQLSEAAPQPAPQTLTYGGF